MGEGLCCPMQPLFGRADAGRRGSLYDACISLRRRPSDGATSILHPRLRSDRFALHSALSVKPIPIVIIVTPHPGSRSLGREVIEGGRVGAYRALSAVNGRNRRISCKG